MSFFFFKEEEKGAPYAKKSTFGKQKSSLTKELTLSREKYRQNCKGSRKKIFKLGSFVVIWTGLKVESGHLLSNQIYAISSCVTIQASSFAFSLLIIKVKFK